MDNRAENAGAAYGRGVAAVITAFAGFAWFGWGFSALRVFPTTIAVAYLSVAVVLIVFAVNAARRGRKMMKAERVSWSGFWETRRKAFGVVVALEVLGCIIVLVLAGAFHRPEWSAAGISFIVGLHFLPLGRIFESAAYYWVGTLMVAWDILTVTALRSWNPIMSVAFATGAILWAVAIYLLLRTFPRARKGPSY